MSDPLIRLRGITKVYGQGPTAFLALKGVDLLEVDATGVVKQQGKL